MEGLAQCRVGSHPMNVNEGLAVGKVPPRGKVLMWAPSLTY